MTKKEKNMKHIKDIIKIDLETVRSIIGDRADYLTSIEQLTNKDAIFVRKNYHIFIETRQDILNLIVERIKKADKKKQSYIVKELERLYNQIEKEIKPYI